MASPGARDSLMVMIGPLIVWAGHFLFIYVFQAVACAFAFADTWILGLNLVRLTIALATVAALAPIAWIGLAAWGRWRGCRVPEDDPERGAAARRRTMALATWTVAAVSAAAVIWQALPAFLLPVC